MNILFLEDEVELSAIGVEQLLHLGHDVYPALNIAEARSLVEENWQSIHLIIADHRLPDGRGIDFLMEIKQLYPRIKLAVVSGCLTPADEEMLQLAEIPYFRKPLLYRQVIKKLREHYMMTTQAPFKKSTRPPANTTEAAVFERTTSPTSAKSNAHSVYVEPLTPPSPPAKIAAGDGLLAAAGIEAGATPKRKGITAAIFDKLTRKS